MKKSLFFITGTSKGIGKELTILILKKGHFVIGLSSSIPAIKHLRYFHIQHNLINKFNVNKVLKKLKKFENLYLLLVAGRRKDEKVNKYKSILDINYFNQINIYFELKKIIKISKVIVFSSFTIFRLSNIDKGYFESKKKLLEIAKKKQKDNFQCYVLGNVNTKMKQKAPSILYYFPLIGHFLEKKIIVGPKFVANLVYKNIKKNENIFTIPKIPLSAAKTIIFFLEIIKLIFKFKK